MQKTVLFLFIILAIIAGSIWLQCFLSRKKNKWLGLIIPAICFMFSLMTVSSLAMYTSVETTAVTKISEGMAISKKTLYSPAKPSVMAMIFTALPAFLIANIPTLVFLAVYFACREKLKLQTELDKMNIQDLE